MKAMVLNKISSFQENKHPLELVDLPIPESKKKEVLIKIWFVGFVIPNWTKLKEELPAPFSSNFRSSGGWHRNKIRTWKF